MTMSAHTQNLAVPDSIESTKVREASDEHARLLVMYRTTDAELRSATTARDAATAQDRRDYADALSAGKNDPGTPNTDKAEQTLAQVERKRDALELAIGEASAAVTEAVLDDRDVLLAKASQDVDLGASQYRDALDALTGAHAALAQAMATRAWLTRFPEVSAVRPTLLVVPNLLARNGDPENVDHVFAALRDLGDVPTRIAAAMPEADEDDALDATAYWEKNGPQKV